MATPLDRYWNTEGYAELGKARGKKSSAPLDRYDPFVVLKPAGWFPKQKASKDLFAGHGRSAEQPAAQEQAQAAAEQVMDEEAGEVREEPRPPPPSSRRRPPPPSSARAPRMAQEEVRSALRLTRSSRVSGSPRNGTPSHSARRVDFEGMISPQPRNLLADIASSRHPPLRRGQVIPNELPPSGSPLRLREVQVEQHQPTPLSRRAPRRPQGVSPAGQPEPEPEGHPRLPQRFPRPPPRRIEAPAPPPQQAVPPQPRPRVRAAAAAAPPPPPPALPRPRRAPAPPLPIHAEPQRAPAQVQPPAAPPVALQVAPAPVPIDAAVPASVSPRIAHHIAEAHRLGVQPPQHFRIDGSPDDRYAVAHAYRAAVEADQAQLDAARVRGRPRAAQSPV